MENDRIRVLLSYQWNYSNQEMFTTLCFRSCLELSGMLYYNTEFREMPCSHQWCSCLTSAHDYHIEFIHILIVKTSIPALHRPCNTLYVEKNATICKICDHFFDKNLCCTYGLPLDLNGKHRDTVLWHFLPNAQQFCECVFTAKGAAILGLHIVAIKVRCTW